MTIIKMKCQICKDIVTEFSGVEELSPNLEIKAIQDELPNQTFDIVCMPCIGKYFPEQAQEFINNGYYIGSRKLKLN